MTSIFDTTIALMWHLPTLLRLDREARREGASLADRKADWWGNLVALEAKETGTWE